MSRNFLFLVIAALTNFRLLFVEPVRLAAAVAGDSVITVTGSQDTTLHSLERGKFQPSPFNSIEKKKLRGLLRPPCARLQRRERNVSRPMRADRSPMPESIFTER